MKHTRILSLMALLFPLFAGAQTGILDFHPADEVLPLLEAARSRPVVWGQAPGPSALTLLHFSDLHGDSENLERIAANALIANGCELIVQQSYTNGAAETCEKNQIDFIGSTVAADKAPNFAISSIQFDWTDAYTYAVNTWAEKGELPTFWCEGASGILPLNEKAFTAPEKAKESETKITETETSLADGTLHVFDTKTWTVDGKAIETTAGEESDGAYQGKEYIKDGYFHENELSANPKFAFAIDGVSVMN